MITVDILGYYQKILFIALAAVILITFASWRIFSKAGEAGWKSLIPIYSQYTTFKISWNTQYFWIMLACLVVSCIFNNTLSEVLYFAGNVARLTGGAIYVIQQFKLSKIFGHGIGFGFGLWFFKPVFALILAFGSSKYEGFQNHE